MEETLLSHISVAQSGERCLKQQCPGYMGSPKTPDMTYKAPVLLMDPSHH